jgi:hypothetical protein
MALPAGLNKNARAARRNFSDRPYFRQAKTFRKSFVSDVYESVYNGNSTIFLCQPLVVDSRFVGLLFSAAQPGAWKTPEENRQRFAKKGIEFTIVDSNGILLMPTIPELMENGKKNLPAGESEEANLGYSFHEILKHSRRDRHIGHIVENIVPVGFDDDIHEISSDYTVYSMAANVKNTKWKLFLTEPIKG